MDKDRQVRFLLPPFFLYFSLLIGKYFSCGGKEEVFKMFSSDQIIKTIGILLTLSLPVGFMLSTVTILVVKLLFIASENSSEFWLSDRTLGSMCKHTGIAWDSLSEMKDDFFWRKYYRHFVQISFNHGILKQSEPGIYEWTVRRYSWLNIALSSCIGVLLSYPIGKLLKIGSSVEWFYAISILVIPLFIISVLSYLDTWAMEALQAGRSEFEKSKFKQKPWTWN